MATEEYEKNAIAAIVTNCIETIKPENSDGCNKLPAKLGRCIRRGFFKACPADQQDTSGECNKIREMMGKGHN